MPMRRDFEALDRTEAAAAMAKAMAAALAKAMAEAREWDRVASEAAAGREKYRGVSKVPSGKYRALIKHPTTKVPLWLGTYNSPVVAACAYDLMERSLRGDRARPNFAYPPPPHLVSAVAATPRRRRHSYPAPPAPPAPATAPFGAHLSFQAPATRGAAPFQPYPYPHAPRAARARIVLPVSASPASSAKTCLSSTLDPKMGDSASSSSSCRRSLMLVNPTVLAVPTTTTTSTAGDCEFTGDNFTRAPFPWDLNL